MGNDDCTTIYRCKWCGKRFAEDQWFFSFCSKNCMIVSIETAKVRARQLAKRRHARWNFLTATNRGCYCGKHPYGSPVLVCSNKCAEIGRIVNTGFRSSPEDFISSRGDLRPMPLTRDKGQLRKHQAMSQEVLLNGF